MTRFEPSFLDDLRERLPISDLIGQRVSWDKRKSNPRRGDWWGCCPFHGERSPSFHCEDKKGRYHCFGCGVSGDHFRFLMEMDGLTFPRAVEEIAQLAGVSLPTASEETPFERAERERRERDRAQRKADQQEEARADLQRRVMSVRELWSEGMPIVRTPAEVYLLGRGIPVMAWPLSLRFHPRMPFNPEEPQSRISSALMCGVQDRQRKLVALWRIFITADGRAITGEDGRKVKLGFGPAAGAAVRLGPAAEEINVCEGVETGLGVGNLTGWKHPVWPLMSTAGMIGWEPPEGTKRVGIYSDGDRYKIKKDGTIGDPPGRMAAAKLKQRLESMKIVVTVREPPPGSDWLDVWNTLQQEEGRERDVQYHPD